MSLRDLRQQWRREIEQCDGMIAHLAAENRVRPADQDAQWATADWLEKLRHWRAELKALLEQYPGEG